MRETPKIEMGSETIEQKAETSPYEKLNGLLALIAQEINKGYDSEHRQTLLNQDCSVNMEAFGKIKKQGLYSEEEILGDKQRAKDKEIGWSSADNPRVQEFCVKKIKKEYREKYGRRAEAEYKKDYGNKSPEEIVIENKKRSYGSLLEMAITVVFHKLLKNDFFVVRASQHDDYENGIDHLIVRKSDGVVVGAFDEVNDETTGQRFAKKLEKVKNKAEKGGAKIKYGFTFEKNPQTKEMQLKKKCLRNVPSFYLPLSTQELKELLRDMNYDLNGEPSDVEIKVFSQLIDCLKQQAGILNSDEKVKGAVKENLFQFADSLKKMQIIRK